MATTLQSPGVSVSVINESFYTSSAPGTVPLIFVATAQDKSKSSGTGTAQGTTAANNGKVWLITSQRDLTDTFGTPLFYTDANQNPIHGGEQNEYGLQSAYSVLGITSQVYVARANVDTGALTGSTSVPAGAPMPGTYWVDTASSLFGINEWNSSNESFTVKTPLIIDDSNEATVSSMGTPKDSFGKPGDYAVYVTSDNGANYENSIWYKKSTASSAWTLVSNGFDGGKLVKISPHTQYPNYTSGTLNGSVWIKTTTPGYGANWVVKYYSGATNTWGTVSAPIFNSSIQAIQKLDAAHSGLNIPTGTLFVESDPEHAGINVNNPVGTFRLWRRNSTGPTVISATSTLTNVSDSSLVIRETLVVNSTATWSSPIPVYVGGSSSVTVGEKIAAGINTATVTNVVASYDSTTHKLTITHLLGGDIEISQSGSPLDNAGFAIGTTPNLYHAPSSDGYAYVASNWKPLVYESSRSAPYTMPSNGTLWYDTRFTDVDIMVNDGTHWKGYRTVFPDTDPMGPTVSATMPTTQQDGSTSLAEGDIWIDTSNIDQYGQNVYVWNGSSLTWVLQDVTDHYSPSGWVFADARWSDNGTDDPEYIASIEELLLSNYVDPDVVDPALYPKGTRLWNLRRSGFNIKRYEAGYININANNGLNLAYEDDSMADYSTDRWVSISPNSNTGVGTFGRLAQRAVVVASLKSLIDTNQSIRDTDTVDFNLIACPGYPETLANMAGLNLDRGQTALVVGDTPFRLPSNASALSAWGNNTNNALDNGDVGLVTHDAFSAIWYPSGYTTDNTGNNIVVPPSHMMLNTIINSDNVSYPWFAPAGTNRGNISNASSVGYVDPVSHEFVSASIYQGLRDVLSPLNINPIATIPGVGLVAYGQNTLAPSASAEDRINVVRLVAYLRKQLEKVVKPFLFQPNDSQTRNEVKLVVEGLLTTLVGQRALNDFVVVCDTTNNTPTRIDQSQLWVDIAVEPVKAVEFIYIPLRLLNTGAIASGNLGAGFPGSSSGV
jgi:hypothetical protein